MKQEMAAHSSATQTAASEVTENERAPRFKIDNRFIAPVFITFMLLVGQLSYGILESYKKTLLAIASAIVTEILLGRILTGKWPHLASAYISGISVGILVRATAIWPYIWCGVVSILSKYVLRVKDRHLWNPSNFGISSLLFLAPFTGATLNVQWGNSIWPMLVIWTLGSIIIYRLKRFHISATYVAAFLLFALVRSQVTGHGFLTEVAPITGPMYQLFVFFMITDPKTTVHSKAGQCAVAVGVAFVEMILRLFEVVHAPYYALFLVGPMANLIEISLASRRLKITRPEPATL
jgi:Na+-translocating ferredoxin:NAD+ oxidoreductase RnfD subunit